MCRGAGGGLAVEQPERTAGGSAGCWPRLPASPRATRSAPMAWALRARAPVARLSAASHSGLGVRRSTAFAHLRVAHPRLLTYCLYPRCFGAPARRVSPELITSRNRSVSRFLRLFISAFPSLLPSPRAQLVPSRRRRWPAERRWRDRDPKPRLSGRDGRRNAGRHLARTHR